MKIGIPVSTSKTQYYVNTAYVDYVEEANMEPMLITPRNDMKLAAEICDGLLLPGGIDIEPTFYDEENIASYCADRKKDDFERKAFISFLTIGKPIFGICRGFQLIAREYLGATDPKETAWLDYRQHVEDHSIVEILKIPRDIGSHSVVRSGALYGGDPKESRKMFVNSMHHQALVANVSKRPPESKFDILAATKAGMKVKSPYSVVEAFRINELRGSVMAVQWHAEELRDYKLIQSFFGVDTKKMIGVEARSVGGSNG